MQATKQAWRITSDITTLQQVLQWLGLWRLLGGIMSGAIAGVWSFLTHLPGPVIFVLVLAGFTLAVILANCFLYMRERHIPALKPKRSVFPYVRTLNASPVIDAGEEYVTMSVFFPSQLDRVRLNLEGQVTIDGHTSDVLSPKDVMLSSEGVSRVTDWKVPLTKAMLKDIQEHHASSLPVKISASIWDRNRKGRYKWETEEWTTLLLTKLS